MEATGRHIEVFIVYSLGAMDARLVVCSHMLVVECVYVYLSIYLSIYLFIYMCVCLHIYIHVLFLIQEHVCRLLYSILIIP